MTSVIIAEFGDAAQEVNYVMNWQVTDTVIEIYKVDVAVIGEKYIALRVVVMANTTSDLVLVGDISVLCVS